MKLTYWTLKDTDRENHWSYQLGLFDRRNYTTLDAAIVAANRLLNAVAEKYREDVDKANERHEPGAAQKAWDKPEKHAAEYEARIDEINISALKPSADDSIRGSLTMRLEPKVMYRRRWREARMKSVIAKDGTTTVTYQLAKPGPWSGWEYHLEGHGGCYLPVVEILCWPVELDLDCDAKGLLSWVVAQQAGALTKKPPKCGGNRG